MSKWGGVTIWREIFWWLIRHHKLLYHRPRLIITWRLQTAERKIVGFKQQGNVLNVMFSPLFSTISFSTGHWSFDFCSWKLCIWGRIQIRWPITIMNIGGWGGWRYVSAISSRFSCKSLDSVPNTYVGYFAIPVILAPEDATPSSSSLLGHLHSHA